MKTNCEIHCHDNITVRVHDKDGNPVKIFKANKFLSKLLGFTVGHWVEELHDSNLITTAGLAQFGNIATNSGATTKFQYIAIGSDGTTPTTSDTALGSELTTGTLARKAATHGAIGATQTLKATFTAPSSTTVNETGVFDDASVGVMLNRYVFGSPISLETGSSIEVDHEFTLS